MLDDDRGVLLYKRKGAEKKVMVLIAKVVAWTDSWHHVLYRAQ